MLSPAQLLQLANRFGTPLYVYDADKIREQYAKLTTAFAGLDARFFFACKALTNINVLRYIVSLGCGIDCSSINEVRLALHAGAHPSHVLYTSNGIAFDEIAEAVEAGVHVNIDSLSNLEKFGKAFGNRYPVGVRLRPNILAGGNLKISTGHERSKFGIPVDQVDAVLALAATHDLRITALHIHTGSDIKDADVFLQGVKVLAELVPRFPHLSVLDLGGGFKVPYEPQDEEADMPAMAAKLKAYAETNLAGNGRSFQFWFEPGKYLVSECGYLLATVNVVKDNGAQVFAGLNTGLNHLIRPMMYDAYHRISNLSNPQGPEQAYTVTGYICETDNFATDRLLPEVREGDCLAIHNAGAYGFEMASNYNARLKPAEVLVKDGEAFLIRRRETFDDLLRHQVQTM